MYFGWIQIWHCGTFLQGCAEVWTRLNGCFQPFKVYSSQQILRSVPLSIVFSYIFLIYSTRKIKMATQ